MSVLTEARARRTIAEIPTAEYLAVNPDPLGEAQDVRADRARCLWCPERPHYGSDYCSARCEERHAKSRHIGTVFARERRSLGELGLGIKGPTRTPCEGSAIFNNTELCRETAKSMRAHNLAMYVFVGFIAIAVGCWIGVAAT